MLPLLEKPLAKQKLVAGDEVFIRIFKQESQVELWMKPQKKRRFILYKTYPICNYSGGLGPKQREGDFQSPEGFYVVTPAAMNPNSSYHLSFNLGYPNQLERDLGRTGSFLMVHGGCDSIGCYALTDPLIEELYTLVNEAMLKGQDQIQVQAFPFRLTKGNLASYKASDLSEDWLPYWENLQQGFDAFEATKVPPHISVADNAYRVKVQGRRFALFGS